MSYRAVKEGDALTSYVVLEKLGQGGFGTVWKAEAVERPGELVALKIPSSPRSLEMLEREAGFQAQLSHPNIVRVLGLNARSDPPYLVLEYVGGMNLRQLMLREGLLPPSWAMDIALQACRGLSFAHAMNILHKDIKPENILLERSPAVSPGRPVLPPRIKIADLGLGDFVELPSSRIVMSAERRSAPIPLSGTIFYMAPEQRSRSRTLDARADVYSLGVVLYESLTGELPMGVDFPSELNPVVPRQLDAICKRALSLDRDRRYPGMVAMAADLEAARESLLRSAAPSRPLPAVEPMFGPTFPPV